MGNGRKMPPTAQGPQGKSVQQPPQSHRPGVLQPKAAGPQVRPTPAAPPVYRPQPVPKVLQRKAGAAPSPPAVMQKRAPAAPPAYRPQPTPKVLQRKTAAPTPPQPPRQKGGPQRGPEVLQLKKGSAPPPSAPRSVPKAFMPPTTGGPQRGGVVQALRRISDVVPPSMRVTPAAALKRYIDYLISVAYQSTMPDYLRDPMIIRLNAIRLGVPEPLNTASEVNRIWGLLNVEIPTIREYEQPDVVPTVTPSGPVVAKRRTVTDEIMNHIANGGLKDDGRPTGLHTIHGGHPIAEPFGAKTPQDFGCYVQAVRLIADNSKIKKKPSTFYPDDWSLDDIREAIEYANSRGGPSYEVTRPEKGRGMLLHFNGDSYFPNFG
jgi:Bacterial EndoU nuclease